MNIQELLNFSVQQKASDLHLTAGMPPLIRVDGDIRRINVEPMDHKTVHGLIYEIMNDKQRKQYEADLEADFSFEIPGLARFRVNTLNTLLVTFGFMVMIEALIQWIWTADFRRLERAPHRRLPARSCRSRSC